MPVEPVEQPPPKNDMPKNCGGQDVDMVVDAVPCELITQEVSLSNLERERVVPQLTKDQAKNQIR